MAPSHEPGDVDGQVVEALGGVEDLGDGEGQPERECSEHGAEGR